MNTLLDITIQSIKDKTLDNYKERIIKDFVSLGTL